MEEKKYKIGVITDPNRLPAFQECFHEIATLEAETSVSPNFQDLLIKWDRLNYDIAVVDDAAITDRSSMEAALRYFMSVPRERTAHMRLIFFAAANRIQSDPLFSVLATEGIYDMVLPFRDKSPVGKLMELVEYPAKRNDVLTFINTIPPVVSDRKLAPPPVNAPLTPQEKTRFMSRGISTIAVAGIVPRAGSTLTAITIARTLVMLGQKPALVVNKADFQAYSVTYPAAMSDDGLSYVINGVTIFQGNSPSVVPRRYTHIILDLGYLGWGREQETIEEQQSVIEFHKADLQVVYVPCTNPTEREWLYRFMASQEPADINKYAIGIWGTTQELFESLSNAIYKKSPDVYLWSAEAVQWPLSLSKIPTGIAEALEPVLPRDVKLKALENGTERIAERKKGSFLPFRRGNGNEEK